MQATPLPEESNVLSVFGAYATAIEEPWDGVIHGALQKAQTAGRISYEFTDDIGYAGDMERVLREVAEQKKPAIIFGDAFGNERGRAPGAKITPGSPLYSAPAVGRLNRTSQCSITGFMSPPTCPACWQEA